MDEIATLPANKTSVTLNTSLPNVDSLPVWLQHGSKVIYDHAGEFHKAFIMIGHDGAARFSCHRQRSAKEESWGVALPNLITEWPGMSIDNIIQPTWNASSFLRLATAAASACVPIWASHVSVRHLKASCPPSLLKALNENFVDRLAWLDSCNEEKNGLLENDTYVEISLQKYRRLRRLPQSVPKTIPSMCVC